MCSTSSRGRGLPYYDSFCVYCQTTVSNAPEQPILTLHSLLQYRNI